MKRIIIFLFLLSFAHSMFTEGYIRRLKSVDRDNLIRLIYINEKSGTTVKDHSEYSRTNDVTAVVLDKITGSITAFADAGGGEVTVTSTNHGRLAGQTVIISGTTSYNGTFVINTVDTNDTNASGEFLSFTITATWVADDATGTWERRVRQPNGMSAGEFDGVSTFIDIDSDGNLFTDWTSYDQATVLVWFNRFAWAEIAAGERVWAMRWDNQNQMYFQKRTIADALRFRLESINTNYNADYTYTTAPIGGWICAVARWRINDASPRISLFIDGVEEGVNTGNASSFITNGNADWKIGSARSGAGNFHPGDIGIFVLWDSFLSDADIARISKP
jgi:hypothetical protein